MCSAPTSSSWGRRWWASFDGEQIHRSVLGKTAVKDATSISSPTSSAPPSPCADDGSFRLRLDVMCELLGMDCNVPTDIVFSFSGLALRGGLKGPHADGWGLALYEKHAARVFLEPAAAARSPLAKYVRENPIKTLLAIAHVRKGTRGRVSLRNTHPFVRELWGRHFVFAHNGTVRGARRNRLGRFHPIGETDSEHAFCALLGRLD